MADQVYVKLGVPWHPGLTIAGRYRLRARLGGGAAAEVWRAFDSTLQALIAIKLLDPSFAGSPIAKRFLREARAAAKLQSVNVVRIFDHGLHGDTPYITMELLQGETLAARLDREHRLPVHAVCRIIGQVAKAAAKAHAASVIHRDLKPTNVFLQREDDTEEEIVKVFDFGIAKVKPAPGSEPTGSTTAGTLLGTPQYMSPEQAMGVAVDARTDIYAIGVMAFECMTGELPFRTEDLAETLQLVAEGKLLKPSDVTEVPPSFDAWFARATAYRAKDRFGSAKELASSLETSLLS